MLALPDNDDGLIRHYTFSEQDMSVILQHRGEENRLGFAVQLCYMRYPGITLGAGEAPFPPLLHYVSSQLKISPDSWGGYGKRPQTRREHLRELQMIFGFKPFSMEFYKMAIDSLDELSKQTDKGITLANALIGDLRGQSILLPPIATIERICAEAITGSERQLYKLFTESLSEEQYRQLDRILSVREDSNISTLTWLRQPPGAPAPKHLLEHIERLKELEKLGLPYGIERQAHQNRLLKLAREGGQMTPQHFQDLDGARRYATLTAVLLEARATVIDETIDLHDRIMGALFNKAKRGHEQQFQMSGKEINEKVRLYWRVGSALMEARQKGSDPFAAIESVIPWGDFAQSVEEAQKLARPEEFDFLSGIGGGYSQIRRYAPALLEILQLKAAPAALEVFQAVELLRNLNASNARKVPKDAPVGFVRKRWKGLVFVDGGIDRKFYELCVLSELKNSLRSGDIWVMGSRQFKDFDEYLIPADSFSALKKASKIPLPVATDCDQYLNSRLSHLGQQLELADRLAQSGELPDAAITESGLKIAPLDNSVPEEAGTLIRQAYSLLPHLKITEVLMEVDGWTDFTRCFAHVKNGGPPADRMLLLTAILADAINLGFTKMSESCPDVTYAKLSWLQAWHIRDETYASALAELVNAQMRHPFSKNWGEGATSSSDGQWFKVGGHAGEKGNVNPKYGSEPGMTFYTHISDQYAPFHTNVVNVPLRDATYVLDGLLHHESDLRIEEHYTDTAGFTDHVFALMHLLGFRFAPRIRDLADKRLYAPNGQNAYAEINVLIGGAINEKQIRSQWDEILRLAASIKQGTVTASLMLRKLGSYRRQNGLAVALRELGRIERSLFMLDWMQSVELRRRVQSGLNKGEARNALARAVFFNRLGELRDRSFENQRYRASGLNLATAAIILWNTVYLDRAVQALKENGQPINDDLLRHLSPLGWDHINLTGDYAWQNNKSVEKGKFRPLRPISQPSKL